MDGLLAKGARPQIAIISSNPQAVFFDQSTLMVPPGSRSVTFFAYGRDLPQSATATISATYAGLTKTQSLTVTPAAISRFGCVVTSATSAESALGSAQCSVVGGDFNSNGNGRVVGFAVDITAPAPGSGYKIPLIFKFANASMEFVKTLEVPAGKTHGFYPFHTEPTESTYILKVTAKDPITHNSYDSQLTVDPPEIDRVWFYAHDLSQIPLGGKDFEVDVEFKSSPPKHGIAYDVTYGGTTDIKGPARVRIDTPDNYKVGRFTVRVFPCGLNPPCHVGVSVGGHGATAPVNP